MAFQDWMKQANLIGGDWVAADSGETIDVTNPATGDVIGTVPKGGWAGVAVWIDSAFSSKETSDRFCISLAGRSNDGRCYLIRQEFGRFDADERVRVTARFLADCAADESIGRVPSAYVQRTTPDIEFMNRANDALMRAGMRAAITAYPEKGSVPGKVERANSFADAIGNGQVYIMAEHREFRREASVFPHGQHDDVFDCGMGALMVLTEAMPSASLAKAVASQMVAADDDSERPDWMPDYSWLRETG